MAEPFFNEMPPDVKAFFTEQLIADPDMAARLHAALDYQLFTAEAFMQNFETANAELPALTPQQESVLTHPAFAPVFTRHALETTLNVLSMYLGMTRRQQADLPPIPPELLEKYSFFEKGEH